MPELLSTHGRIIFVGFGVCKDMPPQPLPEAYGIWYRQGSTQVIQVLPDPRLRRSVRFRCLNQVLASTETIQAFAFYETFQRAPRFDASQWVIRGSLWLPVANGARPAGREEVVRDQDQPLYYVVLGTSNGGGVHLGRIVNGSIENVSSYSLGVAGMTIHRLMMTYARLWTGAREPEPTDDLWPIDNDRLVLGRAVQEKPKVKKKRAKKKAKVKALPVRSGFARLGDDEFDF